MDPQTLQTLLTTGMACHQAGDLEQAEACYRQVIGVVPDHPDALHLLGIIHYQRGQNGPAAALIEQAITLNDTVPAYHCNLGNALRALDQLEDALTAYEDTLRLAPEHVLAQSNRGNVLLDLGRAAEALTAYETALQIRPEYAEGHSNRSRALMALGRPDEAAAACEAALRLRPSLVEAYISLGGARRQLGQTQAAVDAFDAALCLQPDSARLHCDRGAALAALGRTDEALRAFDTALSLQPDCAEAFCNRGFALMDVGRTEEAITAYTAALTLRPDLAEAYFNRGMARLVCGDFRAGWQDYEWRWRCPGWPGGTARHQHLPRWQGEGTPSGQTLLLWAEQGLGDTLQFARYLPQVVALGWSVVLEVQPGLETVLAPLAGPAVRIIPRDAPRPAGVAPGAQCPLLSLPLVLKTTLDTIPAPAPLSADPGRSEALRARLPQQGLRIGIVWQGNPNHHNDRNRSVPLSRFAPLAALPDVHLISLQKGPGCEQLGDAPVVQSPGPEYDGGDFAETAATVAALDLVITVDTAIAHLAGSLGVPVWVLLPAIPDWRWLTDRDDSPWYPSLRLFRQPQPGDWDSVFRSLTNAVLQRLEADRTTDADRQRFPLTDQHTVAEIGP